MRVISFLFTAFLGAGQFLLLAALLKNALASNFNKTAILLMAKLMLYGAAAAVMVLLLRQYIIAAAIGYASGVPCAALVHFAVTKLKGEKAPSANAKGDDVFDTGTDN